MKKTKIFIKKIKRKLGGLDKPMIRWSSIAIKSLIFIHLLNNFIILLLTYNNDDFIITTLLYLLVSNIIVYKALQKIGKI